MKQLNATQDGVVLLTGCDKTTPACIMAAATLVSIPVGSVALGLKRLRGKLVFSLLLDKQAV